VCTQYGDDREFSVIHQILELYVFLRESMRQFLKMYNRGVVDDCLRVFLQPRYAIKRKISHISQILHLK